MKDHLEHFGIKDTKELLVLYNQKFKRNITENWFPLYPCFPNLEWLLKENPTYKYTVDIFLEKIDSKLKKKLDRRTATMFASYNYGKQDIQLEMLGTRGEIHTSKDVSEKTYKSMFKKSIKMIKELEAEPEEGNIYLWSLEGLKKYRQEILEFYPDITKPVPRKK